MMGLNFKRMVKIHNAGQQLGFLVRREDVKRKKE